LIRKVGLLSSD